MRTVFSLSLVISLAACGGEQQVGADALWQVRCSAGVAGCAAPGDAVDLTVFDGQQAEIGGVMEDISVRCSLSDLPNETRLMNVRISGGTHVLDVQNVVISNGSGAIAGTGRVVIQEGDIDLRGDVGSTAPTPATPCRISPVTFSERNEGPTMSFALDCREISNPANPGLTRRDLTFPGMSATPADINVFNCDGL